MNARFLILLAGLIFVGLRLEGGPIELNGHRFTLREGFVIELVAGPPLVDRPIVADFDEQGRLYVADSAGVNDNVQKQLADKPHRIVRLEDSDGDGRFDKSVVFADKMMFPEGVLWHDGAVYSGAPPSIWKLRDTDKDGVADERTEWFKGGTLTGCANDLHGPYEGLDGWIYWCKGAFAKQTHEQAGRVVVSDSAAHIFRCRADGSGLEAVMSGGMDNPVEVAFTPVGELIFTTTFYTNPEGGRRDALVHSIYGGVYPKVHGVLDGLKRTGDLMPALTHLGPAVPSGLLRYEGDGLGREFKDNLISTQFNMHRVQLHRLERMGSTFRTVDEDVVSSDNADFHPTDVLEDADGSLLVLDTGGWYKLCCPTSQLAKPDVLGAVYRIRRVGMPTVADARGLKLKWSGMGAEPLAWLLDDPRFAVRKRAITELGRLGETAIPALAKRVRGGKTTEERVNAVWALTRIDGDAARAAIRAGLDERDATVWQAVVQSAGLRRDTAARERIEQFLESGDPHLKRNAATALGRMGDKGSVPRLLAASVGSSDRPLEHALIYALIEIADREGTAKGLNSADTMTRRAALIALDQMTGGGLTVEQVAPWLAGTNTILKETAAWVAGFHPEWGQSLAGFYRSRLRTPGLSEKERGDLQGQLSRFARNEAIQALLADVALDTSGPVERRELALRAMAQPGLREMPLGWEGALKSALADASDRIVLGAVGVVRSIPAAKTNAIDFRRELLQVAGELNRSEGVRLEAVSALPAGVALNDLLFAFLRGQLEPGKSPATRSTAATILGRSVLNDAQLVGLAESLRESGPLEISRLLTAFDQSTNEVVGLKWVSELKEAKALSGLRADMLRPRLAKYPRSVQEAGEELVNRLNANAAQEHARLETLLAELRGGDIRRGQLIFNGTRAACATCHQVGYMGGKVGPDLTRVGSVRTERDLVESIVFPSASFVRSYEPVVVVTRGGEEYSGVLRQETAEDVVLVSGAGAEQRVAMSEVAEMRPGGISVMPGGLDEQLSKEELADLVAFLKSLR